jgi:CMP-N-acetylneuraminic acid synthetase
VNLAYIQARGGSKRFPRKNLALWNGIPMVADAIEKAKATGLFDIIAVSSDDPEILRVAHDCGVLPLWRTPEASSDTATDDDVAREVLEYFPEADIICKLYPCIPLIQSELIRDIVLDVYYMKNTNGIYTTDTDGKDAGAVYVFRRTVWDEVKTLRLNVYPWYKAIITTACDINTYADLEEAKRKAGIA